jgi:hypothetical protein
VVVGPAMEKNPDRFPGARILLRQRILDAYDALPWLAVGGRFQGGPPKKTAGPLGTGGREFSDVPSRRGTPRAAGYARDAVIS